MKRSFLLPIAIGLTLSLPAVAAPAKKAQAACPSQKFSTFFAAFSDSVPVQKAFTDYPLTTVMLDHAVEPEPRKISKQLPMSRLSFPLIPPKAVRTKQGLAFRVDQETDNNAKVSLFKEDTGYQVAYFFRKDTCWKLERREDWSM